MKKATIVIALAAGLFLAKSSVAQVNLNINIGAQPQWGPVGYDRVEYYYLPAVETYYYVPKNQFIYQENERWIFANRLPARYQGYDLYNGYKVVINEPRPYLNFKNDRVKYLKYKTAKSQPVIKYSKDPKYRIKVLPPGQAKKIMSYKSKGKAGK